VLTGGSRVTPGSRSLNLEPTQISAQDFRHKFRQLVLLAWTVPPVFGLSFLLFLRIFTPEQILGILIKPIEPAFIVASLLLAFWYLERCVQPVIDYLEGDRISQRDAALERMRAFPVHFWSVFLVYLLIAPASVIVSAEIYTNFVAQPADWFRVHLVALIVSIIVGLPIFFLILDLFGRAISGAPIRRPHLTIKTKVFLIGALVPLLIDTTLVQYFWTRTGFFTTETFVIWLLLELLAIGGSILFTRSFGQSLLPLQEFIEARSISSDFDVSRLRALSTDELGVITSDIRGLAEQLAFQSDILEIRNQVLAASSSTDMLEEAFTVILDIADVALAGDISFLLIYDKNSDELVNVTYSGAAYRDDGYYRLSLVNDSSLAVLAYKSGQTIAIDDVTRDARCNRTVIEDQKLLSSIATPLRYGESTIGVLISAATDSHRHYGDLEIRLIEALAQEAALVTNTLMLHQEQRRAEQRYRELNELAPDPILLLDEHGVIHETNRAAEELFGKERKGLIGVPVKDYIARCTVGDLVQSILDLPLGEAIMCQAELTERAAGVPITVDIRASRLALDGVPMIQAFLRDITRQKLAEAASRRSQEKLTLHVNQTPIGVIEWNTGFEVMEWNPAAEKIFGYTREEALNRHAADLLIPEDVRAHVDEVWRALLKQKGGQRSTNDNITKDGRTISCEWYNTPLVNDAGDVIGVASLVRDITASKRAEESVRKSEQELSAILNSLQDTFYRTDVEGRIVRVSPSVEQLLGYAPQELMGRKLSDFYVDEDGRAQFLAHLQENSGTLKGFQAALRCKDRSIVWVSTNAQYYRDVNGDIAGVEGTTRDITKFRRTQEELFKEKERAQVTLESIGDGVITTDVSGNIEYINPVAEQICGWTMEQAESRPFEQVFRFLEDRTRLPIESPILQCLEKRHSIISDVDTVLVGKHGREFAVEFSASPLRDRKGGVVGVVLGLHDVTEMRQLAQQLTHQATHDSLTGLINRHEFELRLKTALDSARNDGVQHALCYLDLDQFKIVNDTCGHIAGDKLLKQVTARLREKVRKADTLARLGGDEFGVLLWDCPLETALNISDDLRQAVKAFRFSWEDRVFEVGVSIGLVPIVDKSGTLTDVLSAADSACYAAKDQGRNRVHVYQPDDKLLAERHGEMQWVSRITSALEEDRLMLYGQRIKALGKGDVDHWELLVRLRGENGEVVPPMAFIPAAERYHIMPAIDRWVLQQAFGLIADHGHVGGEDAPIFNFNLSGQSLSDDSLLEFLISEIGNNTINPEKICFEITETAAIADLTYATRFIAVMTGLGCRFALDDFGSGLSSFAYLKNLNVSYLKIDGGFVRNMVDDAIDYAMVESINHVGHTLGIKTMAEFVESEKILNAVYDLGIDFAQGYNISKPVPITHDFFSAAEPKLRNAKAQ
jgi:diguanylate cyclase (GGDEF)-like protein/PAS domain S-box-containing protein